MMKMYCGIVIEHLTKDSVVLAVLPTITPCHANNIEADTGGVLDIRDKGLGCDDVVTGLHGQCEGEPSLVVWPAPLGMQTT